MKRLAFLVGTAVIGLSTLTACGGSSNASSSAPVSTPSSSAPATAGAAKLSTATVGADCATEAAQVLDWLRKHGAATFTARELHQSIRGRKWAAKREALDAPLALLDDYGHIRPADNERNGPGRPPELYELHPSHLAEQESPS